MAIKEILLFLPTYPDPAPDNTLESAAFLAQHLNSRLTASVPHLSGDTETWPSPLGAWPADVRGLMEETVRQSGHSAHRLAEAMAKMAADYHVPARVRRSLTTLYAAPQPLIDMARLHDLTVMPCPESDSFDRRWVEPVIFNSGRPTLLLPSGRLLQKLDNVVVAWDYSREASRALADAMPILTLARRVHILSVFGEKGIETSSTAADLDNYLASHELKPARVERTLTEGSIHDALARYGEEAGADLLVMGAYGHSRFREFVLGGATRGMIADPPLPIFLSH